MRDGSQPLRHHGRLIAASLLGTVLIGLWLRWALAGAVGLPVAFAHLRHAHSHLGYFGILFPLAWLGWRAAGVRVPGRRATMLYAGCTVIACVGFVQSGYGGLAIAGCTAVAGLWVWSAWPLLGRMARLADPLGAVPLGLLGSLACVPPIALTLRSDPSLAHGFVSTFLAGLLLVVIIPSTLAGRRISPGPWPLLLMAGVLASLALGVLPAMATRAGLLLYAALLVAPALSRRLALHARVAWGLVALGLGGLAVGLVPNIRPVALGAIHFLILGPVLTSLAPLWLRRAVPSWAWWAGHLTWGILSGALVAQAFVAAPWTWTLAAIGGTGVVLWWAGVFIWRILPV